MGLLSIFKRESGAVEATKPLPEPDDSVQTIRTRARRRLVGALLLVVSGVIVLPWLFERQPRPLPVDIPIEIARTEVAAPVPAASQLASKALAAVPPNVVSESPAEAGHDVPAASTPPASAQAAPPAPEPKPEPKPTASEGTRAQALLEAKPSAVAAKPAAAEARFVVQVGAFAEAATAREVRQRVEKLGFKAYTQVLVTSAGKRIRVRVGPFGSRDEADKASNKIKAAGLPSAVYTL